jgi:hypothetical protein
MKWIGRGNMMKRLLGTTLFVPVILILASTLNTPAEAQRRFERPNQGRVCFYTDDHYRGDSFCANPGESMPNVGGRYNDKISSIRIEGPLQIIVFDDENFEGARRTFSRDVSNLHDLGWNDRITSFQVSGGERGREFGDERRGPEPRSGACFYVDAGYRGQSFCLNRGENDRNIGGHFNDRISSIRIFGGARVTVFSDENFGGQRMVFDRDVRNLRDVMNDQITSISVR